MKSSETRISAAETEHKAENTREYWKDMKETLTGRNKLYRVGEDVSNTLTELVEQNRNIFVDSRDESYGPYIPQGEKFHQFDVLTHISTSEEVLRNGKALESIKDQIDLEKVKAHLNQEVSGEMTKFDAMLTTMRLHDAGKLFEDREPLNPEDPYKKNKNATKEKLKGSPYKETDHFDIGQEIIQDLEEKDILDKEEGEFIAKTLQAHSLIQKTVYEVSKGKITQEAAIEQLAQQLTAEQLLNGTLAVISDEFAKGTPPQAEEGGKFYQDQAALEAVSPKLINRALELIGE